MSFVSVYDVPEEEYTEALTLLGIGPEAQHIYAKRVLPPIESKVLLDLDGGMPGVLRFGKRENGVEKKEVPGVLRFGKRNDKKSMPGVLRFGKRSVPGVLRFGKREMPGVLRFGKRTMPGVLRFGKRHEIPGMMRFGKRSPYDTIPLELLDKKNVPGVLRFGK
ncbi:FMRFamide prepropeptide [Trichostrongylus colubriformis]|uniref:FMRFamide prepropeptide n=1 Tax=Trichostrongylus colubriformis TaxID=6319 RepID=A0AAN8FYT0_TRICO